VVGIFPNDPAITRLVGAVLLEPHEHWQLDGRRMFSDESMATIPELGATPLCNPWLYRTLPPTIHPGSDERLDGSIVPIHRGE
jgi:hypothetical protein